MLEGLLTTISRYGLADNSDIPYPAGTVYKGVMRAINFITGNALLTAMGVTQGTSQNSNAGWLHFTESNGTDLYLAKKSICANNSWEYLQPQLRYGWRQVVINGDVYVCRLMTGGNKNPTSHVAADAGGEYNRYIYSLFSGPQRADLPAATPVWGYYTADMLGLNTTGGDQFIHGELTICKEADSSGHLARGYPDLLQGVWYQPTNSTNSGYGWRPMLVKRSTLNLPFIGEVTEANLITMAVLTTAVGMTSGTAINPRSNAWLKFLIAGKTLYIAKQSARYSVLWEQMNPLGIVTGTTTIVIGGLTYKVRLLTGVAGGEYDTILANVWDGTATWDGYPQAEIGNDGSTSNGDLSVCQEACTKPGVGHIARGYPGFTGQWYQPTNTTNNGYGWRPVLELVP